MVRAGVLQHGIHPFGYLIRDLIHSEAARFDLVKTLVKSQNETMSRSPGARWDTQMQAVSHELVLGLSSVRATVMVARADIRNLVILVLMK